MTEHEAYIAFNLTDRIGSVGVGEAAAKYGSVAAAWEQYGCQASRSGGPIDVPGEEAKAKKYGVTILTPVDEGYPEQLKNTRGHPLVLYVKGNVDALSKPSIAIVGTRRATSYGRDQANRFGYTLAERGWCIVSGLATGIDGEAHRGALEAGGVTVGILGSALDQFYPEENRELAREMVKKGGAVVSEFPFGRPPDQQTFPQRNRIVAALARGVIAIEAPVKSGTLITTSLALHLGRHVMALPGRVDSHASAGCLTLLRQGATLVRCADDVEEELQARVTVEAKRAKAEPKRADATEESVAYTIEEALVMRHVTAEGVSMDRLIELTLLDAGKVNTLAMSLRIKGRVRFLPGNRVALPRSRE